MTTLRNKILVAAIRKISRHHANRLQRLNRLISSADLSHADLSHADLAFANFSDADLRFVNLSCANLRSADFSYADLRSANLSYANLSFANLSFADFSSANAHHVAGVIVAACYWTGHGECGRQLLGIVINNVPRLFCGCFNGTEQELRDYIDNGDAEHKQSRTKALDFVMSCLNEDMGKTND